MSSQSVKVWDLPTRVFHWAIVLLVTLSWITIENRWMIAHAVSGSLLFALLLFRIVWGFIGSTTARFGSFLVTPKRALDYLRASAKQVAPHSTGHNPSGGWMVVVLIGLLLLQTVSGMFGTNDLGFNGPLATLVDKSASDWLTHQHGNLFYLILACVWFHVLAVLFYWLVKGDNLIKPMINGRKDAHQLGDDKDQLSFSPNWHALVISVVLAGIVGSLYI